MANRSTLLLASSSVVASLSGLPNPNCMLGGIFVSMGFYYLITLVAFDRLHSWQKAALGLDIFWCHPIRGCQYRKVAIDLLRMYLSRKLRWKLKPSGSTSPSLARSNNWNASISSAEFPKFLNLDPAKQSLPPIYMRNSRSRYFFFRSFDLLNPETPYLFKQFFVGA